MRAFASQGISTFVRNKAHGLTTIGPHRSVDQIEIYVFDSVGRADIFFTAATKKPPQAEIKQDGSAVLERGNVILIFHAGQGVWKLPQVEQAASELH